MPLRVVLEVAPKRSFASAIDWPGWSRSARTPDDAVATLLDYAPRYAKVAKRAKMTFEAPSRPRGVDIVDRTDGGGGTDFGVPSEAATIEREPLGTDADRVIGLLEAAWATFDDAIRRSEGIELRKGPRGGGRDQAKIVEHVREAEVAYLGQLGSRPPSRDPSMERLREAFVATLRAIEAGEPLENPRNTKKPWPPRYAIRRSAWHALDHAWEIEDRS